MRCEDVRLALGPDPEPHAGSPALAQAFEHYSDCPECQQFFAAQQALKERLSRLTTSTIAPAALRQRIRDGVLDQLPVTGRPRRLPWLAGAGGLVAAAAVLTLFLSQPSVPPEVAEPLVQQAQVELVDLESVSSTAAADLERWLENQVGYPVEIPRLSNASLVGARVADLGGTRTPTVIYQIRGRHVTYFALPSGEVLGNQLAGRDIMAASADGYQLALWTEHGLARAIVAPMPKNEVIDIAVECRAKAGAAI